MKMCVKFFKAFEKDVLSRWLYTAWMKKIKKFGEKGENSALSTYKPNRYAYSANVGSQWKVKQLFDHYEISNCEKRAVYEKHCIRQ